MSARKTMVEQIVSTFVKTQRAAIAVSVTLGMNWILMENGAKVNVKHIIIELLH